MTIPAKMKCSNCKFWAFMETGKGECGQMNQPEMLTTFFVRHLVPTPTPTCPDFGCWTPGPPPDTKYKCCGALITDKDFYCASFEERNYIDPE